jgi:hypothetical protein
MFTIDPVYAQSRVLAAANALKAKMASSKTAYVL